MPPKPPRAASPREIRRAFGPAAVEAVNSHADAIAELNKQVTFLTQVLARGFVGRLLWLLRGK